MVTRVNVSGAEIHVETLYIKHETGGGIMPDLFHITCTINKAGKPDDQAIAVLCSSPFKDVAEVLLKALKHYLENRSEIEVQIDQFNAEQGT